MLAQESCEWTNPMCDLNKFFAESKFTECLKIVKPEKRKRGGSFSVKKMQVIPWVELTDCFYGTTDETGSSLFCKASNFIVYSPEC